MASRSKQQLEDAMERNNLSGKGDEFFNKLKSNGYEPLPDPKRFRIGRILKPIIILALIAGALYLGYNFLTSENSPSTSPDEENNSNETKDEDENVVITNDSLTVTVKSNLSIGNDTSISYTLPNSFSEEDIDSKDIELHLLNEDSSYAGYIGMAEHSSQSFNWDPKKVYENNESDIVKAPIEGSYKIAIALKPKDNKTQPLSEVEKKKIGDVFNIEYDRLSISGDKAFAGCHGISDYKQLGWYNAFKNAIDERGVSENSIQFICYSSKTSLAVFASSNEFAKGHPTIMRFLTETESLSEAVYVSALTTEITANSVSIGRRRDSILPILINGVHTLNYDFLNNTIRPA